MRKKFQARLYRKARIAKKIRGTAARPRLCVYRSLRHLHAQLIDDVSAKTLLGLSTLTEGFSQSGGNKVGARAFGVLFEKKAREKNYLEIVFDRGGFLYHGRVKEFAEGARQEGLVF